MREKERRLQKECGRKGGCGRDRWKGKSGKAKEKRWLQGITFFRERVGDPQLRVGCRLHEACSNSEDSGAGHTG